jgi:hypothetical protein
LDLWSNPKVLQDVCILSGSGIRCGRLVVLGLRRQVAECSLVYFNTEGMRVVVSGQEFYPALYFARVRLNPELGISDGSDAQHCVTVAEEPHSVCVYDLGALHKWLL